MMINWEWFLDQNLKTRRYYDMEDFYAGSKMVNDVGPFSPAKYNWSIKKVGLRLYGPDFTFSDNSLWETTEIMTLFNDYIFPNYWNSAIAYSDELDIETPGSMSQEQFKDLFEEFVSHVMVWIRQTAPAYIKEIKLYASIENDLMAQIGNTTKTTFNDTPQIGESAVVAPVFATNISKTEVSMDTATPIERLKEVRDNIRNVYENWSKEFRKFVINY